MRFAKGKILGCLTMQNLVVAINAKGCANYTRKQLDALVNFVKTPQVGATGLIYCKYNEDGTSKIDSR